MGFFVSIPLFMGCKKEAKENFEYTPLGSEVKMITNNYSVEDYLVNPNDADDEKVSRQLHEMGLIARNLFTDNRYNSLILSAAQKSASGAVSMKQFIEKAGRNDRNSEHFSKLSSFIQTIDLTHKAVNPAVKGEIEQYVPAIFVPNADGADLSKTPIISTGIYVNSTLSGNDAYENYIVAWYPDGQGNFTEFLLSEETAMSTKHPIFVMDNAQEVMLTRKRMNVKDDLSTDYTPKNTATAWFSSNEYQINISYENDNYSEFCITAFAIRPGGTILKTLQASPGGAYEEWKEIASVHKNDIGVLKSAWSPFAPAGYAPYGTTYVFWNTYERDWANSQKNLGFGSAHSTTVYLSGNMRFANEWYAYEPVTVGSNRADLDNIYNNWAKWHDNSKGRFRIWRIQP